MAEQTKCGFCGNAIGECARFRECYEYRIAPGLCAELEAWRALAEYRYPGTGVNFIEFTEDGYDKVMTAPTLDERRGLCFFIARAKTYPECAIQLAEMIRCSGDQPESESETGSESDSATCAISGLRSGSCPEQRDACEVTQTSADSAGRSEG